MSERKQLTNFQKGRIVALKDLMSHRKIGIRLKIPHQTVSSFLERLATRGSIENLHRSGAPRKTSISDDRYIVRTAECNTRIPLAELRTETITNISEQTIRRRLREAGIRKWRPVDRPLLNKNQAKLRLAWAQAHRHWTVEDWRKVIWSDECAVKKDSDPRRLRVFRRQNKQEKYASKNIQGKSRDGYVSQMVWGCFLSNKLGPIAFIDGTVNKDVYIDVIRDQLMPFIDALRADGITNIVFQQDNARPHTAEKTKKTLNQLTEEHGFSVMTWPPNSPDMNPIEQLWPHLKLQLHRRYPDTSLLRGSPDTIRRELKSRLLEIWWAIGEEFLDNLISSMPHRVQALIEANGWYTDR
jgi:transposase